MTEREKNWEIFGVLQERRERCEKARQGLKNRDAEIMITGESINFYLSDVLSEDENKAILEIVDSLLMSEIAMADLRVPKIKERLREE